MSCGETLVRVEGVSKKFCRSLKKSLWYGLKDMGHELTGRRHGGDGVLRPDEFWAVQDVSFELKRGECLGLIGRNGAGKTTLLRMLNGLIKPDRGRIEMRGSVGALIALGAGFNPILTGRENIYINASVLGLNKLEINAKLDEIIDFAEIGEFIDMPVQSYSSGMNVRLGFAVATCLNPDIIILDEVLAVGDAQFRAKCYNKLSSLLRSAATILVSHNESDIRRLCSAAIFLENGLVKSSGSPASCYLAYNQVDNGYGAFFDNFVEKSVTAELLSANLEWGDFLELKIKFHNRELQPFFLRLSIENQGGGAVAEWNSRDHGQIYSFSSAEHTLNIDLKLGPIKLVEGAYNIHLVSYDDLTPYRTLIYRALSFRINGPQKLFSDYRL